MISRLRGIALALVVLELGLCRTARGQTANDAQTYLPPSVNDWDEYGLLQDPSARVGADGDFNIEFSDVSPYQRYEVQATVLPWLEASFRYTDIQDRLYGPISFSGSQHYKDRAVGIKALLLNESADFPAMAVGIRDIAGTSLFESEYIVFSRRYYNWDFSAGMGWGLMGTQDAFPNPLGLISKSFDQRPSAASIEFFHGRSVGLFGGFEYHTPWKGVTLKLELDPDSYQEEPLGNAFKVRAPINAGIDWKPLSWLDLSAGFERGTTAMLRFTIHGNFNAGPLFRFDTPPPPLQPRPTPPPATGKPLNETNIPQVEEAAAPAPGPLGPDDNVDYRVGVPLDRSGLPQVEGAARLPSDMVAPAPVVAQSHDATGNSRIDRLYTGASRLGYDIEDVSLKGSTALVRVSPRPGARHAAKARLVRLVRAEIRDVGRAVVTVSPPGADMVADIGDPAAVEAPVAGVRHAAPPPQLAALESPAPPRPDVRAIAKKIFAALHDIEFTGESFSIRGDHAYLVFSQHKYRALPEAIGRAARVVANYLPPNVEAITLDLTNQGMVILSVTLMRRDLENGVVDLGSPEEIWEDAKISNSDPDRPLGIRNEDAYPQFDWGLSPQTRQQIGGPNAFLLYQIYADLYGSANLRPGLSVQTDLGFNLYNNFNKLTLQSTSTLPHVRSDIADYLKQGANGIFRLQADYLFNIAPSVYGRLSAGYLEEMFAGVDGEVLYRPYNERWAVGLDLNHVYQRAFNDLFGLRNYQVTTGHLSLYYQLPWYHILAHLYVGQYLAGDRGATIELSRRFDNGITIGAFATKTNANVTGEAGPLGSIDKGFFISVPLDLFFGKPSDDYASYVFRPLTVDAGQMLDIAKPLYDATDGADPATLSAEWPTLLQ